MQAELKRRNVFHKSHGNSGPGSGRMKSHNYQNYAKVLLHIAEVSLCVFDQYDVFDQGYIYCTLVHIVRTRDTLHLNNADTHSDLPTRTPHHTHCVSL